MPNSPLKRASIVLGKAKSIDGHGTGMKVQNWPGVLWQKQRKKQKH
jgi:hypothetical protein